MALATAGDADLMDELFGSSSGSEGEDDADPHGALLAAAAAAQAGTRKGLLWRTLKRHRMFTPECAMLSLLCTPCAAAAAAAVAVAAESGRSRFDALSLPIEPEPEPEPKPEPKPELSAGAAVDSALEAALAAGPYDDGSVAATLFRQWPLVALVKLPGIGGGRGVVTTQAVTAGTVLMSEAPFIPPPAAGWGSAVDLCQSGDDDGQGQGTVGEGAGPFPLHIAVAHLLLATGGIRRREMQELHPQSLDPAAGHLTETQLERCWKEHASTVDTLLRRYQRPPGSGRGSDGGSSVNIAGGDGGDGGPYSREEVLRCVLAVQFNAFGSGLYLALAMINHSCRPNASKFEPRSAKPEPKAKVGAVASNGTGKSEIVAVVDIPRGAEVTIHYANPITRSHRSRVDLFEAQHHFTLSETSPFDAIDPLLDGAISPESAWVATASVERRLDALEPRLDAEMSSSSQSLGCLDEAQSCLKAALAVLPPQHLVVVRGHLAVVRAAQAVIGATARRRMKKSSAQGRSRTNQEQAEHEHVAHAAAVHALRSCVAVGESRYLTATHHERATTASDTASLLGYLLSANPDLLYHELVAEGFGNFSLASRAEFAAKKRAEALQALYE